MTLKRALEAMRSVPDRLRGNDLRRAVRHAIRADPTLAARFLPHRPQDTSWALPPVARSGDPTSTVPPPELWIGYGKVAEAYLAGGRRDLEAMEASLARHGVRLTDCRRLLDLGCGAGRILRWVAPRPEQECWGADVSAAHVLWCQDHLSPPFHFVTTTSFPHLPFEDGWFDLVYAASVFTHIADLADAWLLEVRRILRSGGVAWVTIHDEHTIDLLLRSPAIRLAQKLAALPPAQQFWTAPWSMFTVGRGFDADVFYTVDFIRRRWGGVFEVLAIEPEAHGYQAAVVLRKRD